MIQTEIRSYNFLIVGKSGAGKSATTRLLTANPSIAVANSLNQVTKQSRIYEGISFALKNISIRFRIIDIPGLDRISNRFIIREQILKLLQKENIVLHGILYVSSLTERDTVDNQKLFQFVQQLPWPQSIKKNCLIPILTKYDNFVIDSLDDQIRSTKLQFKKIFQKAGYSNAWSKRIYWVNPTKSLDFKMKTYQQIKIVYQNQIERLIEMISRNKSLLTTQQILISIQNEEASILNSLFQQMQSAQLPYNIQNKRYTLKAKIQIQRKHIQQSVTVLSASSIAIFIAKVLQRQIPVIYSIALMSFPIGIALLTMKQTSSVFHGKKIFQESSGVELLQTYERVCHLINLQVQNQWKQLNNMIELKANGDYLYCIINSEKRWKFIDLTNLRISMQEIYFENIQKKNSTQFREQSTIEVKQQIGIKAIKKYRIKMPKFQNQLIWQPIIQFQYGVRIFEENRILTQIEFLRQQYYRTVTE